MKKNLEKEIKNIKSKGERIHHLRTMYNTSLEILKQDTTEENAHAVDKIFTTLLSRPWKLKAARSGHKDMDGEPYMNNWKVLKLEHYTSTIKFTLNKVASLDIMKFSLPTIGYGFYSLPKKTQFQILNAVVYKRMLDLCTKAV